MILLWLLPTLLVTLATMLWLLRKPNEFAAIKRRERAIEVLRDINPRWSPPELKRLASEPLYTFDDVQEQEA